MGQIPGLGAPTSNINVPFGCAITVWLYYHWQGIRAQGLGIVSAPLRIPAGRAEGHGAVDAADRVNQPPVARAVAHAASVRQHLRRAPGGAHHREHRPVHRAAADPDARPHRRPAAGVHLHDADGDLPQRRARSTNTTRHGRSRLRSRGVPVHSYQFKRGCASRFAALPFELALATGTVLRALSARMRRPARGARSS